MDGLVGLQIDSEPWMACLCPADQSFRHVFHLYIPALIDPAEKTICPDPVSEDMATDMVFKADLRIIEIPDP